MVYYLLSILAELENVTDFQPAGGCDDPTFRYILKLKCENCGEVSPKEVFVMISQEYPLTTGRGVANLVQKCKLCGREGNIKMITGEGKPLTLDQSQREEFGRLMVFDSRGFELTDFSFEGAWKVQSVSGKEFVFDLSGGEYSEYDEKGKCPIAVSNCRSRFSVVRKVERRGRDSFV